MASDAKKLTTSADGPFFVEIDVDKVKASRAIKIICDVMESRNIDKITAAAAMHVLILELEAEGVILKVTVGEKDIH